MKNTFVKVLSFVMALMMVVGTFGTLAVFAADCTHENAEKLVVPADCGNMGYTKYDCPDCGKSGIMNPVPATGAHAWKDMAALEPTCDKAGYTAHKLCTVCEKVEGKTTVPATGEHKFLEIGRKDPTCTEPGFEGPVCVYCGTPDKTAANYKEKAAEGHDYIYTVKVPGDKCHDVVFTVTCSRCTYTGEVIEDRNHTAEKMVAKDATTDTKALEKGFYTGSSCLIEYKSGEYCSVCYELLEHEKNNDLVHNVEVIKGTGANGVLTAADMNKQLEDLGFKVGDKVEATATCQAKGWKLVKCTEEACATYGVIVYEYTDDFAACKPGDAIVVNDINAADYDHTKDSTVTYKCVWCGKVTSSTVVAEGVEHKFNKEHDANPVKKDCTTNGIKTWTCTVEGCTHKIEEIEYATGHVWGEYTWDDCATSTEKTRVCSVCKEEDTVARETSAHDMKKATVAATCVKPAYYRTECANCDAIGEYTPTDSNDKPAQTLDANNHVVKEDMIGVALPTGAIKLEVKTAAGCNNPELSLIKCACGVELNNIKTAAATAAHTWGTQYKVGNTVVTDLSAKSATCTANGFEAGQVCTKCGTIDANNPGKVIEKDVKAYHASIVGTDKATWVKDVAATCSKYECDQYYCKTCKTYFEKEVGTTYGAHTVANNGWVAAIKPTCTTVGQEKYGTCSACGKLVNEALVVIEAPVAIDPLRNDKHHVWSEKKDKKPETCDEYGWNEYYVCTTEGCGAYKYGEYVGILGENNTKDDTHTDKYYIKPHGTEYMKRMKDVAATCTEGGYDYPDDKRICSVCDKEDYKTPKLGHDESPVYINTGADYDCTKATLTVFTCSTCKASYVTDYAAPAASAHKYKDDKGNWLDKTPAHKDADCATAGYDKYSCGNGACSAVETVVIPATGHHAGGVLISLACSDYATTKGLKCDDCNLVVTKDVLDHTAGEMTINTPATCTTPGYSLKFCEGCESYTAEDLYREESTYTEALGHVAYNESNIIEQTATTILYYCSQCKKQITVTVEAVNTTIVADAAVVAAGANVDVTVKVSAAALTFGQLHFVVDAPAFEVVGVKFVGSFEDASVQADLTKDGFAVYTLNTMAGEPVFVTLDGEDVALVTLTLKAKKSATLGAATVKATATVAVTGYNEKNEEIIKDLVDNGEASELTIARLGDVNGDGKIGFTDLQAVASMAVYAEVSNTRNFIADVNGDGAIDDLDVTDLRNFIKNGLTAAAYLDMTNQDLDAALNALNYNELADAINFEEAVEALFEIGYDVDFDKVFDKDNTKFDGKTILEALDEAGSLEKLVAQLYTIWAA